MNNDPVIGFYSRSRSPKGLWGASSIGGRFLVITEGQPSTQRIQAKEAVVKIRILKQWYTKKAAIITLLVLLFPVGLFLMWKFADWSKKTKWLVSGTFVLMVVLGTIINYNSPPSIRVANIKSGKISTDNAEYTLTGDVLSMKAATLTIDGKTTPLSDDSTFTYKVRLNEGDNTFNLVATNDNGSKQKSVIVHRTTQAEFATRAEVARLAAEKKTQANKSTTTADQSSTTTTGSSASAKNTTSTKTPSVSKPKHSYDSFSVWITATAANEYYWKYDGIGENNINRYNAILSYCGVSGDWTDMKWVACMQKAYSDYLKPETFTTNNNVNDFLSLYGTIYSDQFGQSDQSDINAARVIYERLAATN